MSDNCSLNAAAITSLGSNPTDSDVGDCDLTDPTDQVLTDPLLELLADNGGPTQTHLPLSGSPAIDSGDDDACPAVDQRGFKRPVDGDENGSSVCDVGAIEVPEPGRLAGLVVGSLFLAGLARPGA